VTILTSRLLSAIVRVITLTVCLYACFQAHAASEFKIITLQHRFAEDVLSNIQPLLTGNGTVSAMQNHLIIRTSPENMAEIVRIIATLDVPRQNFKIMIRRQNTLESTDRDTGISGRKRIGNVEVSTGDYPKNVKNGVRIQLEEKQSRTQGHMDQFIYTADGERAFIRVGQSIPYTQEWITLTRHYISVQKTTEFTDIDTGFAVRPRNIGNLIELEITPRIAQLNRNSHIDFEELSTTVRLTRGEWIDLGNIMQHQDEVSRAILNWRNNSQSQNNRLSIRVD